MKQALLALLCASSLAGCHDTHETNVRIPSAADIAAGKEQYFVEQLALLQARNPEADAKASISKGKRHFLCNAGRGSSVPGIPPEVFAKVRDNCPTECLDGVTDALYGESHRRYLTVALDYSAKWNRVMLEACR